MAINKGSKIENTQINEVSSELEKKINYTDALSLEEINASTDLTKKVASASAVKTLYNQNKSMVFVADSSNTNQATFSNVPIGYRVAVLIIGNYNGTPFFTNCILFTNGAGTDGKRGDGGTITVTDNGNRTSNITIDGVYLWSQVFLIVFYP